MAEYSIIDKGRKDFLRDDYGDPIIIETENFDEVEEWLLENGVQHGWTNTGVHYYNWTEEFGEDE